MFMKFPTCRGSSLSALILGPLLCSLWGNGADLDGKKTAECRWADGSITIDGKADESAWKNAQLIDNFHMAWLGPGDPPAPTKTRARLLWNRESSGCLANPALSSSAARAHRDFRPYEDYAPLKFVGPTKSARAFGMEERPRWPNSQVIGTPDPPPPYRTGDAFPTLHDHLPVA